MRSTTTTLCTAALLGLGAGPAAASAADGGPAVPAASVQHSAPGPAGTGPAPPQAATAALAQNSCSNYSPGQASAVGSTLIRYFDDISLGNYPGAWSMLTQSDHNRIGGYNTFTDGVSSSVDTNIVYHAEHLRSGCRVAAEVSFTSYQAPSLSPDGQDPCDNWDLDYSMVQQPGGYWLIDNAQPAYGNGWSSCG